MQCKGQWFTASIEDLDKYSILVSEFLSLFHSGLEYGRKKKKENHDYALRKQGQIFYIYAKTYLELFEIPMTEFYEQK